MSAEPWDAGSKPRIDRLALQGENAEYALMNAPERLSLDEALEAFDPSANSRSASDRLPDRPRSRNLSMQRRRVRLSLTT